VAQRLISILEIILNKEFLEQIMSGNDLNDQTIDFNKAKIISTYKDLNRLISDNNDIISRLTRRLQTTLDCTDIIHMFANEVDSLVNFDQLIHDASNQEPVIIGDEAGIHSCQYNLTMDETDLGSITFSRKKKFIEEELSIIERLASTLVFPLRNAKLYHAALQSALRDELTGCGNKRALDASLHREADLAIRHNSPLSVLMLDVDHFKHINDSYGHLAGDSILKDLATSIKKCARQSDLCYRYGGEEFFLILNDSDTNQALRVAERIRSSIEKHSYLFNGKIIPVTISIGAATFNQGETLDSLKDRADKALYEAKDRGRNRTVSSELSHKLENINKARFN
jgi:diguanylate cyclase (GGDEF)-like protein